MKSLKMHIQGTSLATEDLSEGRIAAEFLRPKGGRDQFSSLPLVDQFLDSNRDILRTMDTTASLSVRRSCVEIVFHTGIKVGSIPLLSPVSGKLDFGLTIRPRFEWMGIGPMMSAMGWKIVPRLLKLPLPPQSDRQIPGWVLASAILLRLKDLIDSLERRFEMEEGDLQHPRGTIRWERYVKTNMSRAKMLDIPCTYPTIRDDRLLKGAIHYVLIRQINDLSTQRSQTAVVLPLLHLAEQLLRKVRDVRPMPPTPKLLDSWKYGLIRREAFSLGIEAIEWTVDETGLAGLSQSRGLPWVMSMSEFFESWIETLATMIARRTGGIVRSGRRRQTVVPLEWNPPYAGTQKSLIPDVIIERENEVVIIDAKYKDHWEEFNLHGWHGVDQQTSESHRSDVLQVLAYASLFDVKKITCWLMYPCTHEAWKEAGERGISHYCASIPCGDKDVKLVLSAVPMSGEMEPVITQLVDSLDYSLN